MRSTKEIRENMKADQFSTIAQKITVELLLDIRKMLSCISTEYASGKNYDQILDIVIEMETDE